MGKVAGVSKPPVWQLPAIIAGALAALGGLGTLAVHYATFATLPERVEAGEQKNVAQDESLNKLATIQDFWQKVYEQQQQATANAPQRQRLAQQTWQDPQTGTWWCCPFGDHCERSDSWFECD